MRTVGAYEAKMHLPEILRRVEKGESILITRRGVLVALLTQPPQATKQNVSSIIEEMLAYRDQKRRTTGNMTIRDMIEDGRRSHF